jgi:NitT/TauT family transport system permease protein
MSRVARAVWTGIAPVYPVLVALLAWEAFARFGAANPRLFPGLGAIAEQAIVLLRGHQLGPHLGASMTRVALGFGLAVVTGVPLGMLMSRSARFGRTVEPLFSLGYPVPRIALYPIAVFIFGIGHTSKVILVALECLYPIAIQTYYGVRSVNRLYIWSAQNMGAGPSQVFWKVIAPAAAPHVFSGFRIALPIAFIVTVLTEMVSSTEGLGWLILYASASLVQARVFASVAIVAVIGFIVDRLLAVLRNHLIFWERESVLVAMR